MKIKNIVGGLGLVFVMSFAVLAGVTSGEAVFAAEERVAYRMDIVPAQNNLGTILPGESYSGEFELRNEGLQDFDYEISFSPYSVLNEEYSQLDYSTSTKYNEITDWLTVDNESGSLQSGERTTISYNVSVPSDTHGGAQVGVIMITMQNNSEGETTGVQTVRQLGYLVYGNVDGDLVKTGEILENKVPQFLFNPPIIGTSLVENTGNVYTSAKYKLQVFPLFSDEEVYTNEEDPEKDIIFPETKRYNEVKWEGAPHLGIFRVRQTVEIFDESSVTEKLVFLCPIWFLFVVLLLIFLIIFWIFSRISKRKREA